MHAAYYRPGGVYRDLPDRMPKYKESRWHKGGALKQLNAAREGSMLDFLEDFTNTFPSRVDEYETLLTDNRIWKQRTVDVGIISPDLARSAPTATATTAIWCAWPRCANPTALSSSA
uniref:NADH dehydrogenase subunit D putative n=1 Tax=Albugo laibachii Nc14 TaxID=890382 RepID=F0X2Z1_9STRA|nr:NADH dehydrogenase subunit D putative [Albugo laibachii Nc14]|eukprot:CCA28377.1 NADH dehydrogenase subunit D putative [Albugo laibachii Nc14]